jgi:hypothetical protein
MWMYRLGNVAAITVVLGLGTVPGVAGAEAERTQAWSAPDAPTQRPERERTTRREDPAARRRSVVYAQAEAGYEVLALHTLRDVNQFPTEVETSTSGTTYGIGAGVRLGFVTLGGRYRASRLGGMDLRTVNGEVGARIAFEHVEPYLLMGAGYASMTSHGQSLANTPDVSISGVNGRAGVGIDFFPDPRVSLGASVMGEVLAMTRPGFSATQNPETQAVDHLMTCAEAPSFPAQRSCAVALLSDAEGSSYAFGATVSLVMGLHF